MDMDKVKDGLKRTRIKTGWGCAIVLILVSWTWVRSVKALPPEVAPAPQVGTKASAPPPSAKRTPPAEKKAPGKVAAKKTSTKPLAGAATASKPEGSEVAGRRDPFKLPPPPTPGRQAAEQVIGPLPPGARGLLISQLRLEGVVRLDSTGAMIAVVDNNANRAYFLRENDAVYNGVVSKITPDSVVFRENALDQEGKMVVREVVKRLGQGPGA
jgi:hypothetical protein